VLGPLFVHLELPHEPVEYLRGELPSAVELPEVGPTWKRWPYKIIYYLLSTRAKMAKVKVSITLDSELASEIDSYLRQLVKKAANSGDRIPKQSNVYEEIVRKGWEQVKRQNKK
jgi:hypothetical protein